MKKIPQYPDSTDTSKELTLALLREELKACKFFNGLMAVGLDHTFYRPDLSDLILSCVGLNDDRDETFDFYYSLMQKHSRKLKQDTKSVEHHARLVYRALIGHRSATTRGNTPG